MTADIIQVKERLKFIIANDLDADIPVENIREDLPLFEDGIGMDSITIVQFIVLVEQSFRFRFADDEMNTQLFSSINHLAEYINSKIN